MNGISCFFKEFRLVKLIFVPDLDQKNRRTYVTLLMIVLGSFFVRIHAEDGFVWTSAVTTPKTKLTIRNKESFSWTG